MISIGSIRKPIPRRVSVLTSNGVVDKILPQSTGERVLAQAPPQPFGPVGCSGPEVPFGPPGPTVYCWPKECDNVLE